MNPVNLEAKLQHLLSVYEALSLCQQSSSRFRQLICEKINVVKARDREFYESLLASCGDNATRSQIRAIMNYDLYGFMPKFGKYNKESLSYEQKLSNEFCNSRHPNMALVDKLLDLMKMIEKHPLYSKSVKKCAFVYIRIVLRNATSETNFHFYDNLIKKYRGGKDSLKMIRRYDLYGIPSWKDYIPGDIPCVVVTSDFKMLRKVSATQTDEQSITFIQMVEGKPVESRFPRTSSLRSTPSSATCTAIDTT